MRFHQRVAQCVSVSYNKEISRYEPGHYRPTEEEEEEETGIREKEREKDWKAEIVRKKCFAGEEQHWVLEKKGRQNEDLGGTQTDTEEREGNRDDASGSYRAYMGVKGKPLNESNTR